MYKKFTGIITIVLLFCGCSGGGKDNPANNRKNDFQIKGSDTMVNLTQVWAEEYIKLNPGINIAVTGGGSGTGIASLISGSCAIAQSSRLMEEKEVARAVENGIKPVKYTVAMDGIAVVVNLDNQVVSLTMDELRDIFMCKIINWKEIGGEDLRIVILSREVNSGTHVFFKEHVIRRGDRKSTDEFSCEALLMPSSQAIADEVKQNPNAIGYYGMGYISPELKTVAVAKDKKSRPYLPNEKNISAGHYPISRPLYLYTDGGSQKIVNDFLDFVMSDKGQAIVKKLDFVPVK